MGITFKSTFSAAAHIKRINQEKKRALDLALESERANIQIRTQKGQGADGALKKYSPEYAKYKREKLGTDTVNLTKTGNMLDAMQTKTEENANGILGKIFFLAQERAKAGFNIALRPNFFKLSREQLATIVRKLKSK